MVTSCKWRSSLGHEQRQHLWRRRIPFRHRARNRWLGESIGSGGRRNVDRRRADLSVVRSADQKDSLRQRTSTAPRNPCDHTTFGESPRSIVASRTVKFQIRLQCNSSNIVVAIAQVVSWICC